MLGPDVGAMGRIKAQALRAISVERGLDPRDFVLTPVYPRDTVSGTEKTPGPALIVDQVATTWLAPGWSAGTDEVGNLLLVREAGGGQSEPLPSIRSQRS